MKVKKTVAAISNMRDKISRSSNKLVAVKLIPYVGERLLTLGLTLEDINVVLDILSSYDAVLEEELVQLKK